MKHPTKFLPFVLGVSVLVLAVASMMEAKTPLLKKAKEAGYADAKDCGFCHVKPKGGKEQNERGKWLSAQKKAKGAKVIEIEWLKDYKPETAKPEETAETK